MQTMKLASTDVATLAENIRAVRRNCGMSQARFAREVGVTQQKVSEWERGVGLSQVVVAWRLADALALAQSAPRAKSR